jgi:hypothetical protein
MMNYDRRGNPLALSDWVRLFHDEAYKRIAKDEVAGYLVSTVWLGLDHSFGVGPPLIFETMVFASEGGDFDMSGVGQWRYATEEAARIGHDEVVEELRRAKGV